MFKFLVVSFLSISSLYAGCPKIATVKPAISLDGFTSMKSVKVYYKKQSKSNDDGKCRYIGKIDLLNNPHSSIALFENGDSTKCPSEVYAIPTDNLSPPEGYIFNTDTYKLVLNTRGTKDGFCRFNPEDSKGLEIFRRHHGW